MLSYCLASTCWKINTEENQKKKKKKKEAQYKKDRIH